MKLSARNVLKGRVKKIVRGSVNEEVTLELPGGAEIVAVITLASSPRASPDASVMTATISGWTSGKRPTRSSRPPTSWWRRTDPWPPAIRLRARAGAPG